MTDKQIIRAEIERRKTNIKNYILRPNHDKRFEVVPEQLSSIIDFIDSMPEESVSPCDTCEGNNLPGICATISSMNRCPLEYRKEKPSIEDLEEELNRRRHEHFYIRFGGIPKDEQSMAWTTENEIKGKEPGVSVYDALYLDEPNGGWNWHLVMPQPITEKMLNTLYSLINYQKRQVYVVNGEFVGRGSDNEPCIRNVVIYENITDKFKLR